jgi:ribA/ribD-fused uncharacterized protein
MKIPLKEKFGKSITSYYIGSFIGTYSFLSNFYKHKFVFEGVEYPTAEHAYQAQKTTNIKQRQRIMNAPTPALAKKYGRKCEIREGWESSKVEIMEQILRAKFSDPILKGKLMRTRRYPLIEGNNWHDNYWGACTCPKCKNIKAFNFLGKLLVRIRSEFIAEALREKEKK